jgi:hypothetical protein
MATRARLTSANRGTTRIIGMPELFDRLDAVTEAFLPIGKKWQQEAIKAGRPRIPSLSGDTRRSLRAGAVGEKTINNAGRNRSRLQARVLGSYVAYFIDSGVRPHGPKRAKTLAWQGSEGTIFARRVKGYRKRPFRARMAREGIRRTDMAQQLIDQWNDAA